MMPCVCGRMGQEHDEDVGAPEEGVALARAGEGADAGKGLPRRAPARDIEAERLQLSRRVGAELAHAHDADAHILRGGLVGILLPQLLVLLAIIEPLLAMMQEHMQHHPFGHALREVGVDDARHRDRGQMRVDEHMIDARAEREDRLEVGEVRQGALGVPPGRRIGDRALVEALAEHMHGAARQARRRAACASLRVALWGRRRGWRLVS